MGTKPHASFLTSTTSKFLPDRDAQHHEDALLLAAGQCPAAICELNYVLTDTLRSVRRTANPEVLLLPTIWGSTDIHGPGYL